MSEPLAERLPPEMHLSESRPIDEPDPAAAHSAAGLSSVPATLLITLAARAYGDTLFPQVAVGDTRAAALLAALVEDPRPYLAHRPSIYGVLARTRLFRDLTARFLDRHPDAIGVNLGCGLADYSQWLDRGDNAWIDADLPEVTALRAPLLPPRTQRARLAEIDLSRRGWWQHLNLPDAASAQPVTLICEGVLMYLQPGEVQSFLLEFGTHAPAGSQLLFDATCWLATGHGRRNPSVRHTGAEFHWGLRRIADLTAAHPRLRLLAEHRVMEGYGFPYALIGAPLRRVFGVPLYAVYQMSIGAAT